MRSQTHARTHTRIRLLTQARVPVVTTGIIWCESHTIYFTAKIRGKMKLPLPQRRSVVVGGGKNERERKGVIRRRSI